ncbi:hypothetical protein BZG35_08330 [Brevundimonas sp. LM2]|uniref:helix-turn-helix domain-containing protein n=1 Tax=Brevundimonas sp. LM2 TaxID=1938605 RepID=UPI000983EF20|nr:helix-turn-helix transcriptional regulator [Brevundimonas sp. LM2]AQR61656.1 hypothetical protein BZG35_08330 [Brevundimonas sp. LM2]
MPLGLSRQEVQCVQLAGQGLRTKAIARQLGLSERTVSNHLGRAYRKLGVRNREAAAARLTHYYSEQETGLSPPPEAPADRAVSRPSPVRDRDSGLAALFGRLPAPPAGPLRLGISLGIAIVMAMLFAGVVVVMGVISERASTLAPGNGL